MSDEELSVTVNVTEIQDDGKKLIVANANRKTKTKRVDPTQPYFIEASFDLLEDASTDSAESTEESGILNRWKRLLFSR